MKYSVDKQRYRQQYYYKNNWVKQKDFILGLIEREKSVNDERITIYIKGEDGVIATKYHKKSNDSLYVHYWLKDNLGSLHTIVGGNDSIVEVLSFDPWGQRRYIDGQPMPVGVIDSFTNDRGFTGHEHLDFFDLINMNGRIFDPIIGRFTSPDPFVQEPSNIQSYNRFAYVMNNPLAFTDPSGYWGIKSFTRPFKKFIKRLTSAVKNIAQGQISKGLKDLGQAAIYATRGMTGWDAVNEQGVKAFGQENWNTIVVTAATIAASIALGPGGAVVGGGLTGALAAGAASGFVGGSLGTILAGGDIGSALKAGLKGATIGAISAGLTYGVGNMAATAGYTEGAVNTSTLGGYAVKVAGHGVVQGAMSEYQGGTFQSGFMSGAVTAAASPLTGIVKSSMTARVMISSAIGGTSS
ncbi:MAG TPA: RHS repeat-associated core domain-containing protein, partial [Saprospiraceae bacterium]|nr:RHS repeat-associated core domain-containing protein [Saprospiraceae bacterium]